MRKLKIGTVLNQEEIQALITVTNTLDKVIYFDDSQAANTDEVNDAIELLQDSLREILKEQPNVE